MSLEAVDEVCMMNGSESEVFTPYLHKAEDAPDKKERKSHNETSEMS
jgi:hypothetical protein